MENINADQYSEEQKDLLKLIPSYSSQGVVIYGQDGGLIYANQTALKMFGVGITDVLGINIFKDPNVEDKDKEALKQGKDVAFETDYDFELGHDFLGSTIRGQRKYFITKIVIMRDNQQNILGYLLTCEDVSEKKYQEIALIESHKKIETIHRNLALALEAGNLIAWNYNVGEEMFYPVRNELSTEKISLENALKRIHPEDREKFIVTLESILHKGQSSGNVVLRFLHDRYLYFDCKFLGIKDKMGQIADITFIQRDITQELEYQEKLLQAKKKAEEADRLKSAFLANMSHEIRTPLNAIVGFSDLLALSDNEQDKQEYVNIISENNELLLRLIGDILDLSKIEANMIELHPECFDVSELYDSLYSTLRLKVTDPGIEFILDNPYAECWVTLDKNRLKQICINFVTNAIKCTKSGHIKMGYEYVDGGIRLYVEDTGVGIAKENHHRVFQRFQKLNDFAQGTGLGLAICRAIVERKKGKIGFESAPGVGSTFWAWMPCEAKLETGEKIRERLSDNAVFKPETPPVNTRCLKIMVAEDNNSNYLLMERILCSHHLKRVYNGQEAVEKVSREPFDVIFMDMRMPVMGGLEATQKIRKFNKDIAIIAVTANAFDTDKENALQAGCNAFLTKPLKKKELFELLESISVSH
ncbi:ATP-binding protein [Culturomica massiliensis]|jgi:PAS domain S-box-containing protein|uniref:ATP-binding protein n=1 Tax=Culturomica massiliensis TaxID=1841857 RepID=UPI000E559E35|nr:MULTISPECIES: ATP-binding protein [Odoribacteraceae]RHV94248.1 response regulator [Odoribacter sp. OF09-27XD]